MKNIYYLLFLFCTAGIIKAQIVNIPDANFKNKLLEASSSNDIAKDINGNNMTVDNNGDDEIQESEALAVYKLELFGSNISDLTGIEAFTNLTELGCSDNNLTVLDLSANPNLGFLWPVNNPLAYVNVKNGTAFSEDIDEGSWMEIWANLPDFCYVCADDFEVGDIEPVLNVFGEGKHVSSYCTFYPGGDYNTITGTLIFDANNDGNCDALDVLQPFIKIDITDGIDTGSSFANEDGTYVFYTQAGSFDLIPQMENPSYFTITPANANVNFPTVDNSTETVNFCITANGVHPDLEIVISPIAPARPGFNASYELVFRNNGNQVMSQANGITFNFDDNYMNYTTASETPSSQGTGTLSWDYANLLPFESRSIIVEMQINTPTDPNFPVNIDDVLAFSADINPMSGDENPNDNTFTFDQTVVGSYDPNDITCIEGDVIDVNDVGEELHYLIRFENTGNFAAENIVVAMDIDETQYDISSLQVLSSSHDTNAQVVGNTAEFFFPGINLDSGGHGNILLVMNSNNGLVKGDAVTSQANIYFDFNYPVTTNEETTFIDEIMATSDASLNSTISIYPNPTKDNLTVNSENKIQSIELFDATGRIIRTILVNDNKNVVKLGSLNNGIYILRIHTEKGTTVQKVIKQ